MLNFFLKELKDDEFEFIFSAMVFWMKTWINWKNKNKILNNFGAISYINHKNIYYTWSYNSQKAKKIMLLLSNPQCHILSLSHYDCEWHKPYGITPLIPILVVWHWHARQCFKCFGRRVNVLLWQVNVSFQPVSVSLRPFSILF